jgi:sporulation protein YlmC with PRC-barrel domain
MKKFSLLSVFIILAMLLVACAPEETEPGVGTPGIPDTGVTPAPGLGTPDPMVTPMETPIVPADTPQPLETPVVTPPAETTPATPGVTPETTPVQPVIDPDNDPNRASNLLNLDVRNMQDESLGDIDDLIISINEEQIVYAIIGRGGFLGIGEDHVAVPYEALTLRTDEDGDAFYFVLDVTEEAWDNAPTIDLNEINLTRADWRVNIDTTWVGTPGQQQQTPAPGDQQQPGQQPGQLGMMIDAVRLTHLLDANVYDMTHGMTPGQPAQPAQPAQPGQPGTPAAPATPAQPAQPGARTDVDWVDVGEIEEIVVDADTGEVRYVVVDVDDNELNLRDVWVPVPMAQLTIVIDRDDMDDVVFDANDLRILVDRQRLVDAPRFDAGALPDTQSPEWDAGIRDYWGTPGQGQ